MDSFNRSVKTLKSSTTYIDRVLLPDEDVELIVCQYSKRIKCNLFFVYQQQDFEQCKLAKRIPLFVKASFFGSVLSIAVNKNYKLPQHTLSEIETKIRNYYSLQNS